MLATFLLEFLSIRVCLPKIITMRNIQLLSKLNKPQNGLCNVRYITYLKITFPSFMTCDNCVCLSIPTKPILLHELRKNTVFLPQSIKFGFNLIQFERFLTLFHSVLLNFAPSYMFKNAPSHFSFVHFLHHNVYKQLFKLCRPNLSIFCFIKSSSHVYLEHISLTNTMTMLIINQEKPLI